MIYTASYFEPNRHHGKLLSISRSIPQGFQVQGRLEFFIPSADLLQDWKKQRIGKGEYTDRYREQIKANLKAIQAWLSDLDPQEDMTLLCWERSGKDRTLVSSQGKRPLNEEQAFCHRNLAIKLVYRFRLDCYGGTDVINYPLPVCQSAKPERKG